MAKTKKTVKAVNQAEVTQNIGGEREATTIKLELSPSMLSDPANRQMMEEFVSHLKKTIPGVKVEGDYEFLLTPDEVNKFAEASKPKSDKAPELPAKLLKNKKK